MCGFCHSTRLMVPLIETGRSTSYSATTEWCAMAMGAAVRLVKRKVAHRRWLIGNSPAAASISFASLPRSARRSLARVDVENLGALARRAVDVPVARRRLLARGYRFRNLLLERALAAQRVANGPVALVARIFVNLVVR